MFCSMHTVHGDTEGLLAAKRDAKGPVVSRSFQRWNDAQADQETS